MEMVTCNVCGKIYGATGYSSCNSCRKLLDIVYGKARTYLRDNPKNTRMKAPELAEAIGEDLRIIEILISEGRFDRTAHVDEESDNDRRRKKLLAEIEKNLATSVTAKAQPSVTYGKDRHGRDNNI